MSGFVARSMTAGAVVALGLMAMMPSEASAGIVITGRNLSGTDPQVTFDVVAKAGTTIVPFTSFFTVIDVSPPANGPVDITSAPGWSFLVSNLPFFLQQNLPPAISSVDDPNIPDITWFYAGPSPLVFPADQAIGDPKNNQGFSYFTSANVGVTKAFYYIDQTVDTQTGQTVLGLPRLTPVPEPATLVLALSAIPILWLARRRRSLAAA